MRRAVKPIGRSRLALLGAALTVSMAFAGISAASASAVVAWNAPGQAKVSGSVTFSATGQPTRTCAVNAVSLVGAANSPAKLTGDVYFGAPCYSGGYYRFSNALAENNLGAYRINNQWNGLVTPTTGPWAVQWKQLQIYLPWTNAAGVNPSKIVLNNTVVAADLSGNAIYATGTINFTTPAGGALTLSG